MDWALIKMDCPVKATVEHAGREDGLHVPTSLGCPAPVTSLDD